MLDIQVVIEKRLEPIQVKGASGSKEEIQDAKWLKLPVAKVHAAENRARGFRLAVHSAIVLQTDVALSPIQENGAKGFKLSIQAVEMSQEDDKSFQVQEKIARGFQLVVHPMRLLEVVEIMAPTHSNGAKILRLEI